MATVVKGVRATNAGIAASRLIVDMGDLYKLEDDQGALYVTASTLGKRKIAAYEANWHTNELRPKFDTVNGAKIASDTSVTVTNGGYFQKHDLVKVTATGEVLLVTAVSGNVLTITRSFGATAAGAIADAGELLILGPAYPENAQLQDGRSVTETKYSNKVQAFRHNFEISGRLQAITENGGTYHGSDVKLQREDMLLTHKRDINLACLFGEVGDAGSGQTGMGGIVEFIKTYGANRVNSTAAVTHSVFLTAAKSATRYNNRRMVIICSRQFAQIVTEWGLSLQMLTPGGTKFGLQVMDIFTPHGQFRLLVDDALEGTAYSKMAICVAADKKGGPKMAMLRDTRLIKNRQEDSQDGYEEEVLTEGTIEHGNANFHYLFDNAQTSA